MNVKPSSLFLLFLLSSIVVLHVFILQSNYSQYKFEPVVLKSKAHLLNVCILLHNVGFSLWRSWAFMDGDILADTLCSLFYLQFISFIFSFSYFCIFASQIPSLSTQCKKQNSAVIFLTDATEQPVRAKITPHAADSIVWIQREQEVLVDTKPWVILY